MCFLLIEKTKKALAVCAFSAAHSKNTLTFYINTSRLKNLSSRGPKLNFFEFEEENRLAAKIKEQYAFKILQEPRKADSNL